MPPLLVFVIAVSSALTFSFLCSIFEATLLSIRPAQVEALAKQRSRSGRTLRRFKRDIDRPIAAILILNTLAHTVGATVAGSSYEARSTRTPYGPSPWRSPRSFSKHSAQFLRSRWPRP